jgi:hypothetical protein
MAFEQTRERAAFAGRKCQDCFRTPPRGQRAAPVVCLGGDANEIHPRCAGVAGNERAMRSPEDRQRLFVRGALIDVQLDFDRNDVVRGKESAGQIGDAKAINDRANEIDEAGRALALSGRRGEAESSRSCTHLERFVTNAATEVVDLVNDEQTEAVADTLHQPEGTLERRHRDRLDCT